jgi:hypothetical protein
MNRKITTETDMRTVETVRWPDGEIGGVVQTADSGSRALINRKNSRDWFTTNQLEKTNAEEIE